MGAKAEFETQRQAETWDMMRSSMDMKTFAELTRKADGSHGTKGERNLSVGAAHRIFDSSARSDVQMPPRTRMEGSRRPVSRGALCREQTSKANGYEMECSVGLARESLPATFGALQASFSKTTAKEGSAANRYQSPSVRDCVQALEGANGGA